MDGIRRFSGLTVVVVVGVVLVAAGFVLARATGDEPSRLEPSSARAASVGPTYRIAVVNPDLDSVKELRAPTASECERLGDMLEASVASLRDSYREGAHAHDVSESEIEAEIARFDASVERSRAWIADGCPEHANLGIEANGGIRLLDVTTLGTFDTGR